ncbi:MAG: class I SAM-dependent methyltransferase [Aquabacterium sp.]
MRRRLLSHAAAAALALAALAVPPARAQGEEVPFITTPDNVTLAMLRLAGVTERDFVLDLGSGDGRIVITAARRFGARGLGVEIVPDLVERSRVNAIKASVADKVEFRVQDLFATPLSVASVITMYLLPEVNLALRPKLLELAPGTRLVSHDWDMGDWQPDETVTLEVPDKPVGREKLSRVHRWTVPARVEGLWCARVDDGIARLALQQRYQMVQAQLTVAHADGRETRTDLAGRLSGTALAGGVAGQAGAPDHHWQWQVRAGLPVLAPTALPETLQPWRSALFAPEWTGRCR